MLENRSPRRIYTTLVSAGFLLGLAAGQLALVLAGKIEFSFVKATVPFPALFSVWGLVYGWQMISSLPWSIINDPAHFEYRTPYGPSKTVSDGGEKDLKSIPSQTAAPEDLER